MSDEIIKRGEIYWIQPSPYNETIGHVQKARRPAIIVSNDAINRGYTFEVVYLTTAPKKDMSTHVTIRSTGRPSTALCEQVQTVSDEQVDKYIGRCTKEEMDAVDRCLLTSLGLDLPAPEQEIAPSLPDTINIDKLLVMTEQQREDERALIEAQTAATIYKEMYENLLRKTISNEGLTPQE